MQMSMILHSSTGQPTLLMVEQQIKVSTVQSQDLSVTIRKIHGLVIIQAMVEQQLIHFLVDTI